jgi:hypothetical protein
MLSVCAQRYIQIQTCKVPDEEDTVSACKPDPDECKAIYQADGDKTIAQAKEK